jgi:hypothetical protein
MEMPLVKHMMEGTPEYFVWASMKARCHNPRHRAYKDYGARGIEVCERWRTSFEHFLHDMGFRPSDSIGRSKSEYTIERIDNTKGYGPENCRWATWREQMNNRRSNRNLTFQGTTMSTSAWARTVGLPPDAFRRRLKHGWSLEKALTTPHRWRSQADRFQPLT